MPTDAWKSKKAVVVGLGVSGVAASEFLVSMGADVKATDQSVSPQTQKNAAQLNRIGVRTQIGGHTEDFLSDRNLFVTSPGVPKHSIPLMYAQKKGIPVISEIELGSLFCPGTIIGLTASNGKTTTCHLIHEILKKNGKKVFLCGNIGTPFTGVLPKMNRRSSIVLELSSFQLEDIHDFKPKIAIILNISPNHLDRHGDFKSYAEAKWRIGMNQTKSDFMVLNHDDAYLRKLAPRANAQVLFFSKSPLDEGIYHEDGVIYKRTKGETKKLMELKTTKLKGEHNLENILAAAAVASILGLNWAKTASTVRNFKPLEHRIERVGKKNEIEFYNDSKSTTVASTIAAIRAMKGPLVLIAGGRDKGVDFKDIAPVLRDHVRHAVLYGEARTKIQKALKNYKAITLEEDFKKACLKAVSLSRAGETILLSPMCTSFDQFGSYSERGRAFKRIFEEL